MALTELERLDQQIAQAKADLDEARAHSNRCPDAETLRYEVIVEQRVNRLLERRHAMAAAEAIVRA